MLFDDDSIGARPTSSIIGTPGIALGDPVKDEFQRMTPMGKVFSAIGEFSAGLSGRPSPLQSEIAQKQKRRLIGLQEFKVKSDALEDSVKLLKQMRGRERETFATLRADELDKVSPGLGNPLREIAKRPDVLESLGELKEIPAIQVAARFGPEAVENMIKSPTFFEKIVQPWVDEKKSPVVMRKVKVLMDQYKLTNPQRYAELEKDGITQSEVHKMSADLAARGDDFAKLALTDGDIAFIARNEDRIYAPLGVLTGTREQAVMQERLKSKETDKGKRDTIEIGVGDDGKTFQKAYVEDGKVIELIGKPYKKNEGVTVNMPGYSGLVTGPGGKPGVLRIGKDGNLEFSEGYAPPPKEQDPVKAAIADAIKKGGGEKAKPGKKPAVTGVPTVSTKAQFDALPSGAEFIDARDGVKKKKQ